MFKYSVTISGNTLAELYSSAAAFASGQGAPFETSNGYNITPAVSDTGNITVQVQPSAPAAAPVDADEGGTSNAEFDSAGIPWDKRIHSETRNTNKDGTWKRRRNTDDIYYASVMAELAQRTAGVQPTAVPATPASPAPAAPVGIVDQGPVVIPPAPAIPAPPMAAPTAVAPSIPAPPAAAAPAVPPTPAAPVAAPAAPVEVVAAPPVPVDGMAFQAFMPLYGKAMQSGRFNQTDADGYLKQWGLDNIGQLATDPAKVKLFYEWLKSGNLID